MDDVLWVKVWVSFVGVQGVHSAEIVLLLLMIGKAGVGGVG